MQPAGPERYPEAISALEQGAANPDFWAASQAIGYSEVAEGENGRREQGNALKEPFQDFKISRFQDRRQQGNALKELQVSSSSL